VNKEEKREGMHEEEREVGGRKKEKNDDGE